MLQPVYHSITYPVFQHMNAVIYHENPVTTWFEQNNIDLEYYPPLLLDLNPIEHVSTQLKKRLHQQYSDTANTPERHYYVGERLAAVLPPVWDVILEKFFEKLWKSTRNRLNAVIQAKGWYTRYSCSNSNHMCK